jgi:RNase P subunit RPR2
MICNKCKTEITDKKKLEAIDMLARNGSRVIVYCEKCYSKDFMPKSRGIKKMFHGDLKF